MFLFSFLELKCRNSDVYGAKLDVRSYDASWNLEILSGTRDDSEGSVEEVTLRHFHCFTSLMLRSMDSFEEQNQLQARITFTRMTMKRH